jgi:hypothetical protein
MVVDGRHANSLIATCRTADYVFALNGGVRALLIKSIYIYWRGGARYFVARHHTHGTQPSLHHSVAHKSRQPQWSAPAIAPFALYCKSRFNISFNPHKFILPSSPLHVPACMFCNLPRYMITADNKNSVYKSKMCFTLRSSQSGLCVWN